MINTLIGLCMSAIGWGAYAAGEYPVALFCHVGAGIFFLAGLREALRSWR